jgi:hypothetical protein
MEVTMERGKRVSILFMVIFISLFGAGIGLLVQYQTDSSTLVYRGDINLSDANDYLAFQRYITTDGITINYLDVATLDPLILHYSLTVPRNKAFPYPYDASEADAGANQAIGYCVMCGFGIAGGLVSAAFAFGKDKENQ